ncbi:4'-phosphopantetheinyl transferase [Klebsiella michiganensis]|uniref:colibactin biosynthesis phosphopantetheinyl transferase ClbA n=1 Tax=Klebsiella michiganensis TaxID=1134687 RepID=UPI000E0269C4|nr:colibactin biosynthesis phosphopantetheinyl transferase ClbA [Klebsiella michiganensis]MBA8306099.1 colibactin biosynthesis phosphopantetheinyl transferase ClbA [Klebsiella michiganensis]MBW5930648.1 4'-phosphopantetheinyl transferase [Klebsiella michiganensis]MBW5938047.1 4'-phosphopantetheinyl transferase [Klebsiella michiganensis]MBW5995785.1 4'-phosphopantetheinyl transferase [Klebsiella michiganensis]MBX4818849.1 colibactin biosynthesis phosphopantetheinyl transferase ClbA [Klebsiella 
MKIDILLGHTSFFHQTSMDNFLHYLNEEETKRYHQFHFVSDKEVYILSRILLKTALTRYQPDVSLQSWQFSTNKYGKPFIVFPQLTKTVFFNLSHTTDTVAIAISSHCELGIDIEKIRDLGSSYQASYLNISQHFFTSQEATDIDSLPPYEGQLLFWKIWTLKEAYIKYRGKGLSLGLDCIEFDLTNKKLTSQYRGSPVYFSQWKICDSLLALASPLIAPKITLQLFPIQPKNYRHDYQLIHSSNSQNVSF